MKYLVLLGLLIAQVTHAFVGSVQVYFSPRDHIEDKLIDLIKHEQRSIKIASFFFTSHPVAKELGKAKQRGVSVEVILDKTCFEQEFCKAHELDAYGVPVYIYEDDEGIMHDKFCIFARNESGKRLLWTGSFNITYRANKMNRENVIIVEDPEVSTRYEQEFELLKKVSRVYKKRTERPTPSGSLFKIGKRVF